MVDKPKLAFLSSTVVLLLILFGYQNCSNPHHDSPPNYYDGQSHVELNHDSLQEFSSFVSDCEDSKQYVCQKKVFSPHVDYHDEVIKECTNDGICFELHVFYYSTRDAFEDCGEACRDDLEPGGKLNYLEYFCYQENLKDTKGRFPFAEYADNLSDAYYGAVKRCQDHSQFL